MTVLYKRSFLKEKAVSYDPSSFCIEYRIGASSDVWSTGVKGEWHLGELGAPSVRDLDW